MGSKIFPVTVRTYDGCMLLWKETVAATWTLTLEKNWKTIGNTFKQTFLPFAPEEQTYIAVISDSSKLEFDKCYESGSELIDMPICFYLSARSTSQELSYTWINRPGCSWTNLKVTGGVLSYPHFREDEMRMKDENSHCFRLTSLGANRGIGDLRIALILVGFWLSWAFGFGIVPKCSWQCTLWHEVLVAVTQWLSQWNW